MRGRNLGGCRLAAAPPNGSGNCGLKLYHLENTHDKLGRNLPLSNRIR